MTTPPPRLRTWRIPAAALVVAGVLAGLLAGTATRSATVSAATTGSRLELVTGAGTVTADGTQYSISTVAGSVTGFVDLVNTSTVPATVVVVVATGNLVASTPATACSQPWVQPAGTCPGTSTVLPQNGSFPSPTLLAAGAALNLRVQTTGVLGAVTLTTAPVVPRAPTDRTAS